MSTDDGVKNMEKETITFTGYGGKVSFVQFDKHMARYMRMKYGRSIGEGLWMDNLPILEGAGRLTNAEFKLHCADILDSIAITNASRVKLLTTDDSPFWKREWQLKWRQDQWERMYDVVSMRCKGQALLSLEEVGLANAKSTRKHLKKQFGGASEDVKHRETIFENGMPEKGKKPFYKGIDIESKLRQMKQEWTELVQMCPAENRVSYQYGKESELVKICLKHLRHSEFDQSIKELLNEIKFDRKLQRAIAGDGAEDEDANIEDWEYRNYKDGWVPTFEKLREKLVSTYKEKKYSNQSSTEDSSDKRQIPALFTKALLKKAVTAMFAPGFGLRPKQNKTPEGKSIATKMKCWACGIIGHKKGDPACKADAGSIHGSAPAKAKRKFNGENEKSLDGGPTKKKPDGLCRFYNRTGTCKFGAACKFKHEESRPLKKVKFSNKEKKQYNALKAKVVKEIKDSNQDDIDQLVAGFLMVRTIPREFVNDETQVVNAMSTCLNDMDSFAYDTGAGEGISTNKDDFYFLDDSDKVKKSVTIKGPSIGAPECEGRGPLVYTFKVGNKLMGLVHPNGILAGSSVGSPDFRLASAMTMKRLGVRYLGGKFDDDDFIECVRTGFRVPTCEDDGILTIKTEGSAKDIESSVEFFQMVEEINCGLRSPLVEVTPFLKGAPERKGESKLKFTEEDKDRMLKFLREAHTKSKDLRVYLMNESKLTDDERARLYCRRFAYCDTNIFKTMFGKEEFGKFPKLPTLNEDNIVADMAKFKRKPFKRNDPANTMDAPPFWRVYVDGYGGQQSLGGPSYEGAVGAYLFVCSSTGSTDIRLYASHKQFPIALHQFLVRVQAEYWKCRVIFVDTHSVNISAAVEEVLALFQVQLMPISTGTPQELAFAESRVRVLKRMSTAMMAGAPHLDKKCWALSDKHSVFVGDFLPQQSRQNHCSFYMRTGRPVDWDLLQLKVFGAPTMYSDPNGPIHKRAPIVERGYFVGFQWPATLIKRESDGKVILVSRQKIRVHESVYVGPLASRATSEEIESRLDNDELLSSDLEVRVDSEDIDMESVTAVEDLKFDNVAEATNLPTDNNMVQSVKTLRNHKQKMIGTSHGDMLDIEESAIFGNVDTMHEGLYVDSVVVSDTDKLALEIAEEIKRGSNMRDALRRAISKTEGGISKNGLARGKNKKTKGGITSENILDSKRKQRKIETFHRIGSAKDQLISKNFQKESSQSTKDKNKKLKLFLSEKKAARKSGEKKSTVRKGKGKLIAKVGDLISVSPKLFDDESGSYSKEFPELVHGTVNSIDKKGIANITWVEDGSSNECKLRDLTVVKQKRDVKSVVAGIIALLIKGKSLKRKEDNGFPKDFFEVLVRDDWRKWVEAIKKELEAWDDNNAVEEVDIQLVPVTAKIVPLGELYTMKRDGTYKYRQYLMGNLLREGIDYDNNFSTTISSTGITVFFSMATTSAKQVGGWDAVAGYLQTTEQFDIYAYLPTHADYSKLEYEEIAKLRHSFLKVFKVEGIQGIKNLARNFKREYRASPTKVYKCNSSIYGNQSAGMEFEKLMNSVHIDTAKMTQTQPEPSMYVRIKVDKNDIVIGYLVVIAFVDDVRYFGTDPEIAEYKANVLSRLKVKFEKPPVEDFVSIETYQNIEEGTFELKMPRYFDKAMKFFQEFRKSGFKTRTIPITILDEKCCFETATPDEIAEAKHLPFLQAIGILSYPASNCKFELRYAVSVLGSKRAGWSTKHFDIAVKLFEYALTTKDIGLIYSKDLDPHGENIIYAYGDASLRIPRPQGCRIIMMNGAAISFVSKMQTLTAPSSTWAESVTLFDTSTDVIGIRNLLSELGHLQQAPTKIYQDNKSTIQIANNRGSLGKNSRAMDLKTLTIRNRIEDHMVETAWIETKEMVADMGSKALPETPFTRFRDTMNGYALVRARFPNKTMSPYVYDIKAALKSSNLSSLQDVQAMIMGLSYKIIDDEETIQEEEEEEDDIDFDTEDDVDNDNNEEDDVDNDNNDEDDVDNDNNVDDEMTTIFVPEDIVAIHAPEILDSDVDIVYKVDVEILDNDVEIEYNDNPFEFNHCWQFKRKYPNEVKPLFELDDLPDPRLYNINVALLYNMAQSRSDEFIPSFENYLVHVEPKVFARAMKDNYWLSVQTISEQNLKFFNCDHSQRNFRKPNPTMFIPPMLSIDAETRKRQIHRALNKFISRLDWHIQCKTEYDTFDNVHWGIASGDPHPKPVWLRYVRWKRYFIHLKLSGINQLSPKYDPLPYGPPALRQIDLERMSLTNCFALELETGQYASCAYGCLNEASPIPKFPHINERSVVLYQYKSIWTLNLCERAMVTLWMGYFTQHNYPCSLRVDRINAYLERRYPVWGRTCLQNQTLNQDASWTSVDDDGFNNDSNDGWGEVSISWERGQAKKQKRDD